MTPALQEVDVCRVFFAEEVRAVAGIRSEALVAAFAGVPRERFLGPGPWLVANAPWPVSMEYRTTPDADARRVYHNVGIAIDPGRQLNNGQPSALALWVDAAELRPRERVLHVGCGTGYYSAIMAEVVGPAGAVLAVERDDALAARARAALSPWPQATVITADGTTVRGPQDVVFVNAGATHPLAEWLDALAPGGRLIVPLTVSAGPTGGGGFVFCIRRTDAGLTMRAVSGVHIFDCIGARDAEAEGRLRAAYARGAWKDVRSLRRDPHAEDARCLLHAGETCWSAVATDESGTRPAGA